MSFNSIDYLVFLPVVFLSYWFVFKNLRIQNLLLVVVSYIFYGWWDWRFLILIAFTSLCSYLTGIRIGKLKKVGGGKKYAALNIVLNLLILGVFKYYNFFVDNMQALLSGLGINSNFESLNIILPVGISFYTFQALSYTIDVYRGKIEATHDIVSFFAYISFFPQLVAGPIERATNLLPQIQKKRTFDYCQAVDGIEQIVWGLFKKMVVADNCAILVNDIWSSYQEQNTFTLISGAIFFTFQIYGDFSGYSDIAIGSAKLFGIKLMRNFRLPYFSLSIPDFWKRWHISLNTWFVDYLYIPLGGSRCVKWKWFRNTMAIFLVSGLWHGANWTFVCWGAYHALLFLPYMLLGKTKVDSSLDKMTLRKAANIFVTFVLVVIGWVIFRSSDISEAYGYFTSIITNYSITPSTASLFDYRYIVLLLLIEWLGRNYEQPFKVVHHIRFMPIRFAIYSASVLFVLIFAAASQGFIYFQF